MPDKYIKLDDALKVLCDKCVFEPSCSRENEFCNQIKGIKAIPAADVEPVRHGQWERKPDPYGFFDTIPVCSVCGCTTKYREESLCCPNCGAKMDGEADNGDK